MRARHSLLGAIIALAALSGLFAPAEAAGPSGTLTIHGTLKGSRLRLAPRRGGHRLLLHGRMAAAPRACRVLIHRRKVNCPLGRYRRIELVMGPDGDEVQVLRKLPLPLTVHLGSGRDKFIGNGERDTCYSEGSRRNRCLGGAGRDVCITGNRNSDCVGGPGNDLCIAGDGSDGCWGGGGDDVCRMGGGQDGCHGEAGNDRLYGGRGADQLFGGPGSDYCDGGPGRGRSHECERGPRH